MRILEVEGDFYKFRSSEEIQNERYRNNFNACMKQIKTKSKTKNIECLEKRLEALLYENRSDKRLNIFGSDISNLKTNIQGLTQRQHEYDILVDKLLAERDERIDELDDRILEVENVLTRFMIKLMIKNKDKIKFSDIFDF